MDFLRVLIKVLLILSMVLLMVIPFLLEYWTFCRDKAKKITYKRFRVVVYTAIYIIGITIAMYFLKEFILWLESFSLVRWIVNKVAFSARIDYFAKVLVAVLVNFAIGALYRFFSKFVRIGLKKKNLVAPKKENGEFNWRQKLERKVIRFFHTETWFFVGSILKYFSIILSAVYALVFVAYLLPAVFSAKWIPYRFISMLFSAGYSYPTISLLGLWEMYFFLEGIKRVEDECPELLREDAGKTKKTEVDLKAIDAEARKRFKDFYVCDVDALDGVKEDVSSTKHHLITEFIAQAVENDQRNPQVRKEAYLDCLDKLAVGEKGLLINGNFFTAFSMYFLRYLSSVIARGDNVVFICNNDAQIDETYHYIIQGLSEISSLYCKGFQTDAIDYDDPIWRVVKVSGERSVIEESSVDDNNILVTSLSYLCSARFENENSRFIPLIDAVVFVDTLNTVNKFNRQLAILNTRLKHITKKNSLAAKNSKTDDVFLMRYLSRQIRYICFDDTRVPGLDKVLKNLLAVDFESIDAMHYSPATLVRCYHYEGHPDENGRRVCPQFFPTDEELSAPMNMAVLCLAKGASNVTVFADDCIPYANIAETISANAGRVSIKVDENSIRLNKPFYNPDGYSVLICMDSGNNLPAAVRRYVSMVSEKPTLVILFSRPYMMRDYYMANIDELWSNAQSERIPVEEGPKKDVAQRILVKANAGGVSAKEILQLAAGVAPFDAFAQKGDISGILRAVLEIYGEHRELFHYFEYASSKDFDENGVFCSEDKVLLRRRGRLFDMINGRDMVIMSVNDTKVVLPLPKSRLTQNYIADQNLLYNGNIYHIDKVDAEAGCIYTRLAVGGKNDEAYQYLQSREYHVELDDPAQVENVFPVKHVVLNRTSEDVSVSDVYISVYRAPAEVVTKGYFALDPHVFSLSPCENKYHSISDPGNDAYAKQTYRRYGCVSKPTYSSDAIIQSENRVANEKGILMMSIRFSGQFGSAVGKTVFLAAVMLNELLRSMFPSVSDSIAVCPVLPGEWEEDDDFQTIRSILPQLTLSGETGASAGDFELVILEDCATDLGVVSVLMSAGDDILNTLFQPIFNYLKWYAEADEKSEYLYYGLDHEPSCFDFASLYKLSKLLGDDNHDLKFVDIGELVEYDVCDFCGKRYRKGDDVIELDDGRKMCKSCAGNLVGNNKTILKEHLERAKIFLESTYGITLDQDYEFCFESTVRIVNALKQNRDLVKRGSDVPLRSYIDGKKKVHVEYSIPAVNLSELLVRELTHVWQLKHLPKVDEDLAEGHIALVAVQYLQFLNQSALATVRTNYYESTESSSGKGYRKLVKALLENPQFNHNPFRYLLETSGGSVEDVILPPTPRTIDPGDYGLPYTPEHPDRALDGSLNYFYYPRLSASCQKAYDLLLNAISNHAETVTVEGVSFEDIDKVTDAIAYDHPELFWYNTFSMCGSEVKLHYGASAEEAAVLQKRIEEVVPKYLDGIEDSMSAYDVALRLHVKVIASVDYDTIALNRQRQEGGPADDKIDYLRTICGVFLDGKAVCEGYARAMQYLLQKCGIECAEVAGYIQKENGDRSGAHAWNILKIDGDYYYLDTTWDDSSNTVQTVKKNDPGFDYFCITAEELKRTRNIDLCPTDVPHCDAIRANYYVHNGMVLDAYDPDKIKAIAQTAAKNQRKFFTFKCKTKALYDQALAQLFVTGQDGFDVIKAAAKANKKILADAYSYSYDKNIWTITVKFKFK